MTMANQSIHQSMLLKVPLKYQVGGFPYTAHGAQLTPPLFLIFSCFYAYFMLCYVKFG